LRPILQELVDLLRLERIDVDLFRGQSQDLGWGNIFGGQTIGQALSAAAQTVPGDRHVHSLHSYFLQVGDAKKPVVYHVEMLRDGKSFATRRVVGKQNGTPIFNLAASFQVDEPGFSHQDPAPDVPGPEGLPSELELAMSRADKIPEMFRKQALAERPIELRPHLPHNPLRPDVRHPVRRVWLRAVDALPDDPALHRYLLGYASDFSFVATAMQPHGVSWLTPGMQVASLDHAMWFHRPFRMDDWLLYDIESPSASGARGLVRGRFFDRQGVLVATAVQEGLMRNRAPKPA